jgi:hypothetical protein
MGKDPITPVDPGPIDPGPITPIPIEDFYTLSFSNAVAGWPSFYSYNPDWMIGMNQYFYTFKGGNLYRHNVNIKKNTFYEPWWTILGDSTASFTPTTLKSVFNQVPLENKLFKTLNLEGDATWSAILYTDIQDSGYILDTWFEKKEQSYFAFVRNDESGELAIRSTNGIGKSYQVNVAGDTIDFSISPLIDLGYIMSIGDILYFTLPPATTQYIAGKILQINRNYKLGVNQIVIDITIPGTTPIPVQDAYFFYTKNSVAESHGVLGHYCVFEITNSSTSKIELFAVESEVMKSFP